MKPSFSMISLNDLDFRSRIITPELIDNFDLNDSSVIKVFNELKWINKKFGNLKNTVNPVLRYIHSQNQPLTIVDIGCGSGDILRAIHDHSGKNAHALSLVGLDANEIVINMAKSEHKDRNIDFRCTNIREKAGEIPSADVYIMSQFLHHFEMDEIIGIMKILIKKNPGFILINDLKRSELAFHLFGTLCRWKNLSFTTTYDGQLSISKGFIKKDMIKIQESVNKNYACNVKKTGWFYWQLSCEKKSVII